MPWPCIWLTTLHHVPVNTLNISCIILHYYMQVRSGIQLSISHQCRCKPLNSNSMVIRYVSKPKHNCKLSLPSSLLISVSEQYISAVSLHMHLGKVVWILNSIMASLVPRPLIQRVYHARYWKRSVLGLVWVWDQDYIMASLSLGFPSLLPLTGVLVLLL